MTKEELMALLNSRNLVLITGGGGGGCQVVVTRRVLAVGALSVLPAKYFEIEVSFESRESFILFSGGCIYFGSWYVFQT